MAPAPWDQPLQGKVVTPASVASPASVAVVNLGEVLKEVVSNLPMAFPHENNVLDALNAIDAFVATSVPKGEVAAAKPDETRAAVEDVSKRIPPGGAPVAPGPSIDYAALARAIMAEQQRLAALPAAEDNQSLCSQKYQPQRTRKR